MVHRILIAAVLASLVFWARPLGAGLATPTAVSPGSQKQVDAVDQRCPTFSWGSVAKAAGYQVVVYEVEESGELGAEVFRQHFAEGVSSWTPSGRRCLARGLQYAWTVAAVSRSKELRWSDPLMFQVAPGPGEVELEQALALVERYLTERREPTPESASVRASTERPLTEAEADEAEPEALDGSDFSVDSSGNVAGLSFAGDGSGLTNVQAASSWNLDCTGCVSEGELDFTPATQSQLTAHALSGDHDTRYFTQDQLSIGSGGSAVHWDNVTNAPAYPPDLTIPYLALSMAVCDHFALTADPPPDYLQCPKLVFITTSGYGGNLGGLDGADTICQTLAHNAGLPGTYKAWLSDDTGSPSTRFVQHTGPYILVDGTIVADSWSDLVDCTNPNCLQNPITLTAGGSSLPAVPMWTNTNTDGTGSSSNDCLDWTSGGCCATWGGTGQNAFVDANWTFDGSSAQCFNARHLFCFQQ
ncbi:MAG: hypothetical protein WBG93_08005 [Thermoanaerobaculia bacterium]